MNKIHTRIRCDRKTWNALRAYAIENDIKLESALERAIKKFLEK